MKIILSVILALFAALFALSCILILGALVYVYVPQPILHWMGVAFDLALGTLILLLATITIHQRLWKK